MAADKNLDEIFDLSNEHNESEDSIEETDEQETTVVYDDNGQEVIVDNSAFLGWFVMLSHKYDSHKDGNYPGIDIDDWKEKIEERFKSIADRHDVTSLAYIFHEPDQNSEQDGEKGFHAHAVVQFNEADKEHNLPSMAKRREFVVELFGASDRLKNVTNIESYLAVYRYMIHASDQAIEDEKRMYKPEDVTFLGKLVYWQADGKKKNKKGKEVDNFKKVSVSGDRAYKVAIKVSTWLKNTRRMNKEMAGRLKEELAEEVASGEIRGIDAFKRLWKEAGYPYAREAGFEVDTENYVSLKYEQMIEDDDRNLRNVYIAGNGGVGKTFLANALAKRYSDGMGIYIASPSGKKKTPDPMNHISDELVVIMNEVGDDSFSVDEFNNSFDPNQMSPFSSRGENKKFIGHTILMTQSVLHSKFSKDLMLYDKGGSQYADPTDRRELKQTDEVLDKYWQVRRRIMNNIILVRSETDPETIQAHVFNLDKKRKDHFYVGFFTFKNPFSDEAPFISEEELDEAIKLLDVSVANDLTLEPINDFVERNNIVEMFEDDLFSVFMNMHDEPIFVNGKTVQGANRFTWNLLPTGFILDMFNAWLKRYEPQEPLWGLRELTGRIKRYAENSNDWTYAENPVSSNKIKDVTEKYIEEYNLYNWMNSNGQGKKTTGLKPKYRGLQRSTTVYGKKTIL